LQWQHAIQQAQAQHKDSADCKHIFTHLQSEALLLPKVSETVCSWPPVVPLVCLATLHALTCGQRRCQTRLQVKTKGANTQRNIFEGTFTQDVLHETSAASSSRHRQRKGMAQD
jgi:hypothetical protein